MVSKKRPAYRWVYSPQSLPKPHVPENLKAEVSRKAEAIINEWRPQHIKPPPRGYQFNYLTDLYTKWHGSFFYFCGTYACPGPRALSPSFEAQFARMEYMGNGRFALAYMRHTGKWWELERGLTLDESLKTIGEQGHYHPV